MEEHQHSSEELEACRQRAEAALDAAAERILGSISSRTHHGSSVESGTGADCVFSLHKKGPHG